MPPGIMRVGQWLACLVLLVPTAAGAGVSGTLVLDSSLLLPPGGSAESELLAALHQQTEDLTSFSLTASTIQVICVQVEYAYVPLPGSPILLKVDEGGWNETFHGGVRVELGKEPGILGYHRLDEGIAAQATVSSSRVLKMETQGSSTIQSSEADVSRKDERNVPYYWDHVEGAHLLTQGAETLTVKGAGEYKVTGSDVIVHSNDRSRECKTGMEPGPTAAQAVRGWAILIVPDDAVLRVEAASPWLLALGTVHASWKGQASLLPIDGALEAKDGRYVADQHPHVLNGDFACTVVPIIAAGTGYARLTLNGDLVQTSMPKEISPLQAHLGQIITTGWALPGLVVAGILAVALGSFGATMVVRRRAAVVDAAPALVVPYTVEDCEARGAEAMEAGDWAGAEAWYERAHRLAPTSASVCCNLAFAMRQLGHFDGALTLLEEARRLEAADGEVEFQGALTALLANRPEDEVEDWLVRALDAGPEWLACVEADGEFDHLRGRVRFEAARRRALDASGAAG